MNDLFYFIKINFNYFINKSYLIDSIVVYTIDHVLIDTISSPKNIQTVIEKPMMHPEEAVMSLLQALNLSKLAYHRTLKILLRSRPFISMVP